MLDRTSVAVPYCPLLSTVSKAGVYSSSVFDHHMVTRLGPLKASNWDDGIEDKKDWYYFDDITEMECCYPIESSAINYLKKIMRGIDSDLKYGGKTKNPAGINKLKPFLASIDERPGAFVEKDYGNSCVLPIMHIEVHSGKGSVEYKNTLAKLLVVMIL